jgi:hypothetical protein
MIEPSLVKVLREAGITNPARTIGLMERAIDFFRLDLSNLVIVTEAGSGPFVVTPVIAAMAGAQRVLAVTKDSPYGSAEAVMAQERALESLCGLGSTVEIFMERHLKLFAAGDIVTNLGFVRPIDRSALSVMKSTAVISLMCEAWELRPGDIDLETSREKGIPVCDTVEDYPGADVFSYAGVLCQKMLFDAGIEVYRTNLLVVSGDKFGPILQEQLERAGAVVRLVASAARMRAEELTQSDAIVVADYTRSDRVVGEGGDLAPAELARLCPHVTIIQFAGVVDVGGLEEWGIKVYPGVELGPHRMAVTLSGLGVWPVIELHTAGLKVGELAVRARLAGQSLGRGREIRYGGHTLGRVM